ncbi:energy transducer TonB [Nitrospira sp. CMX1]
MYDSSLEASWNVHIPEDNAGTGSFQAKGYTKSEENHLYYRLGRYVGRTYGSLIPGSLSSAFRNPIFWAIFIMALWVIFNFEQPVSGPSGLAQPKVVSVAPLSQMNSTKDYEWLQKLLAKWITDLDKNYPESLRTQGVQGRVTLSAMLHEDGLLTDVRVVSSSGDARLDQVAMEDVRKGPPIELTHPLEQSQISVKFAIAYDLDSIAEQNRVLLPKERILPAVPARAATQYAKEPLINSSFSEVAPQFPNVLKGELLKNRINQAFPNRNSHDAVSQSEQGISYPTPRIARPPISLKTGDTIKKPLVAPRSGRGSLRIINGTDVDAVFKFGDYDGGGGFIAYKYIKSRQEYVEQNIAEGAYRLAFSLGSDWDQAQEEFRENRQFMMFEEPFEFEETAEVRELRADDGIETQTTFRFVEAVATLHAVSGGHAKTESLTRATFERLFEERQ